MKPQVRFRIFVLDPPQGVSFAMQRGRAELLKPTSAENGIAFEFELSVADANTEPPRLAGPYAQGPATKRFVYVNSGTSAGQATSCWSRRANVPLYTLSSNLLQDAIASSATLEATVSGKSKDGGPTCATVPFIHEWSIKNDA